MSGVELLLIADGGVTAAWLAGSVASALGFTKPAPEAVPNEELPELCRELREALAAMVAGHRALTAAWRAPLSLLDERAQQRARDGGVPSWAVEVAREAKSLVHNASELSDQADVYRAQLEVAARDDTRDVLRSPVLALFTRLEFLTRRLVALLPAVEAARRAFDAPASATEAPPEAVARVDAAAYSFEEAEGAEVLGEMSQLARGSGAAAAAGGWALVNCRMGGAGVFQWTFEVSRPSEERAQRAAGDDDELLLGLAVKPVAPCAASAGGGQGWVAVGACSGSLFALGKRTWHGALGDRSNSSAGLSSVTFRLDLAAGSLEASVDGSAPVKLVKNNPEIFAGRSWYPAVAFGARSAESCRLVECSVLEAPIAIMSKAQGRVEQGWRAMEAGSKAGLKSATAALGRRVAWHREHQPLLNAARGFWARSSGGEAAPADAPSAAENVASCGAPA